MLGVDLGGSFTKICFISKSGEKKLFCIPTKIDTIKEYFKSDEIGNLKIDGIDEKIEKICITGGGSVKFQDFFKTLKPTPVKVDELGTQAHGARYLLKDKANWNVFGPEIEKIEDFILISMGTGVSFTCIRTDESISHVGGSPLGGGTLMGLANLMIKINDFQQLVDLANHGTSSSLDLLVSDIYGSNYGSTLRPDVCASSFAKASIENKTASNEDIAASLVAAICYSIAGSAAACARGQKVNTLVFIGGFLSMEGQIPHSLYKSASLFSKNISLVFLNNHRHAGAIGAALRAMEME